MEKAPKTENESMIAEIEELSDEELACQTRAGSSDAFDQLITRYEKRIFRFLRCKTPNPEDAEELTQTTFANAYRKIALYSPEYKFSGWLFTIARRLCISFYRKRKMTHVELDHDIVDDRTPRGHMERAERHSSVWNAARKNLPEAQFTALWLRFEEDLSVKEIAKSMNKTTTHVKVLLHRARKKLLPIFEPVTSNASAEVAVSATAFSTTPFAGS